MCWSLFGPDMDDRIRADIEYRMGLWKTDDVSYNKEDVLQELESTSFRNWLDAGQSDQLFRNLRSLESRPLHPDRKMYTVMLAVMIMQSGARISDDNKQHLRDIAPRIPEYTVSRASKPQFEGFRHPGRVQFLAALEHHRPGTRRNFGAKSYYHCGKSEGDKFGFHCPCLICMAAWYCDQDCRRAHWEAHEPYCVPEQKPVPRPKRCISCRRTERDKGKELLFFCSVCMNAWRFNKNFHRDYPIAYKSYRANQNNRPKRRWSV